MSGDEAPVVTRADLVAESHRAVERVAALARDLGGVIEASAGSNADDEHDPEGATIAFERAQVASLLAQSRARLAAAHEALERWDAGTYGACSRCGAQISPARLEARPATTTCIACASTPEQR